MCSMSWKIWSRSSRLKITVTASGRWLAISGRRAFQFGSNANQTTAMNKSTFHVKKIQKPGSEKRPMGIVGAKWALAESGSNARREKRGMRIALPYEEDRAGVNHSPLADPYALMRVMPLRALSVLFLGSARMEYGEF